MLIKIIIKSMLPLSLAENEGFRENETHKNISFRHVFYLNSKIYQINLII
jgi:hypothetical protein